LYHAGKKHEQRKEPEAEQDEAAAQPQDQAGPAARGMSDDAINKLKELGSLHDTGVLTDEEFEAQKAKLLG
jgi:hypothetical protein